MWTLHHQLLVTVLQAAPTAAMTHIAVQEALEGKVVDWFEKVTVEEYKK